MAIRFDGSTGAIYRTSGLVNLDANYTVCFWLHILAHPGAEDRSMLWHQNPGGGTSIDALTLNEVSASDTRLNIYTFSGSGTYSETDGATSLSLNTWYHIGLIRSANNSRIAYINAVQQVNHTTNLSGRSASTSMDMGVTVAAPGDWLNGRIAHIKIWTAALSVAELANEMYYAVPMRTANLNQWHPCMPGATERLADYSGNGRNWTAVGTLTDEDGPPVAYAPVWVVPFVASTSTALVIADAAHAHAADNLALTQHNALTVAEAAHGHTTDNLTLGTAVALTVADAAHAHAADNLALTQHHALTVAEAAHAHAADNLALTQHHALAVADGTHGHTADNLAIGPHYTLVIADAGHTGFADSPTLGVGLVVAEAAHAHTADGVTLGVGLVVADATHAHSTDNLALGLPGVLAVAEAAHGHTADSLALTQHHALAVADATHAHTADNLALTQHYALVIADATHAHTADGMTLSALALVVAATIHLHAADNLALTQHHVLAVADAVHAHTADAANVATPAGFVLSAYVDIGTHASAVAVRRSLTAEVEL